MKFIFAIALFAAVSIEAQTVATTANVMHPLTKNGKKGYAPSSLDRDPAMAAEFRGENEARSQSSRHGNQSGEDGKPPEIVAQIDTHLVPTDLSIIGTVDGLKCSFQVKNVGQKTEIPKIVLAVCDRKGFKIGTATKTGTALSPDETEKINILATNADGADLKIMKLTAGSTLSE